jgi:hypothetical protein
MTTAAATFALPYEHVAFSSTEQVLGTTGAVGDYLHRMVITVGTAATSSVIITDGAFVHAVVRANTPIGVYSIEMNAISQSTGWKVTTGAGVEVLAMGNFT